MYCDQKFQFADKSLHSKTWFTLPINVPMSRSVVGQLPFSSALIPNTETTLQIEFTCH